MPTSSRRAEMANYERSMDGVLITHHTRWLHIERPWNRAAGYASLLWIAIWFGMVSFFTSLGHQSGGGPTLLLVIPGVLMAYMAMTRFFNKTVIDVRPLEVTLRHAPLPWPGNKRFSTRDLGGLHLEVKRIYAKEHTVDECWIYVVRKNGRKSMLVKGLEMSPLQMSAIAAAMSDFLGVPVTAA